MKKGDKMMALYEKYHSGRDYTSIGLFRAINEKFAISKAMYPGCHVHISPSLVFSDVVYVDSFKNTDKFFASKEVKAFVDKNKEYQEEPVYSFYHQNYYKPINEDLESFDLVISQYAGFVGQAAKKYLKKGGILVCNNSHGDASMASIDPDYELIAVYRRRTDEKFSISDKNLEEYLQAKSGAQATKEQLMKSQRGIAYTKSPSGYIFRKVK